jgi:Flp pilus assembly protein TadB
MGTKNPLSTRLPDDTNERFEAYQEERNLSKSEAGKRLVERGLDWETGEVSPKAGEKPLADILRDMGLAGLAFAFVATLMSPEWVVVALGVVAAVLLASSAAYRWRDR